MKNKDFRVVLRDLNQHDKTIWDYDSPPWCDGATVSQIQLDVSDPANISVQILYTVKGRLNSDTIIIYPSVNILT